MSGEIKRIKGDLETISEENLTPESKELFNEILVLTDKSSLFMKTLQNSTKLWESLITMNYLKNSSNMSLRDIADSIVSPVKAFNENVSLENVSIEDIDKIINKSLEE